MLQAKHKNGAYGMVDETKRPFEEALAKAWHDGILKPGTIIAVEGGEGAGKGEATVSLLSLLEHAGLPAELLREPGGCRSSERIRELILEDPSLVPQAETLLFAASRAQLISEKIQPAINAGKVVILDRYVWSSVVYQGIVGCVGIEQVIEINRFACGGLWPDISFFLDIEPRKGLERIWSDKSRETNRIDEKDIGFHEQVREGYLSLVERGDMIRIDADRDRSYILSDIVTSIVKHR